MKKGMEIHPCWSSSPGMPSKRKIVWLTAVWFKEIIPVETTRDITFHSLTEMKIQIFLSYSLCSNKKLLAYLILSIYSEHANSKEPKKSIGHVLYFN